MFKKEGMPMSNKEIIEITKTLENHEKRIKKLEDLLMGGKKKTASSRKSIIDHLDYLKSEGFFNEPRTLKEIVDRLVQESYHYPQTSLTDPLKRAVRQQMLRRIKKDGKWAYCKR
jgi:enoyl reductase-like protein